MRERILSIRSERVTDEPIHRPSSTTCQQIGEVCAESTKVCAASTIMCAESAILCAESTILCAESTILCAEATVPCVTVKQPSWLVPQQHMFLVSKQTLYDTLQARVHIFAQCALSWYVTGRMAKQTLMQTAETLYVSSLLRPKQQHFHTFTCYITCVSLIVEHAAENHA